MDKKKICFCIDIYYVWFIVCDDAVYSISTFQMSMDVNRDRSLCPVPMSAPSVALTYSKTFSARTILSASQAVAALGVRRAGIRRSDTYI